MPSVTRTRGFTLMELMVTLAIVSLGTIALFMGSQTLLPESALRKSAREVGNMVELMRLHALFNHEGLVFEYDLEQNGFEAYYPYLRDEQGNNVGLGRSPVQDFKRLENRVAIRELRLPGAQVRTDGQVALAISALGRMSPHEVILHNVDYPDAWVVTVRIHGLGTSYSIVDGDAVMEPVDDVFFR